MNAREIDFLPYFPPFPPPPRACKQVISQTFFPLYSILRARKRDVWKDRIFFATFKDSRGQKNAECKKKPGKWSVVFAHKKSSIFLWKNALAVWASVKIVFLRAICRASEGREKEREEVGRKKEK